VAESAIAIVAIRSPALTRPPAIRTTEASPRQSPAPGRPENERTPRRDGPMLDWYRLVQCRNCRWHLASGSATQGVEERAVGVELEVEQVRAHPLDGLFERGEVDVQLVRHHRQPL
jgi:hypothetical protein